MMIHPEEIRLLIQQGRAPDYWRVKRGSIALAISAGLKCVLPPLIGMWLGIALLWFMHLYSPSHFNFTYTYIYSITYLLLGIIFSCIGASTARNSAMVFLPEGFLSYSNIKRRFQPYEKTSQAFWYSSIADMCLHMSFWSGNHLEIHFHDGSIKKWSPKAHFGRRDRIIQDVLTAYIAYDIFNSSQAEQITGEAYSELLVPQE